MRVFPGIVLWLLLAASAWAQKATHVEIDLEQQRAYLLQGRRILMVSPISTGRAGHFTQTGSFKVIEKERNHFSSIYGKIVDARGNTVVADADKDMRVPPGGKFIPAPMRYFMRFHEADGMHAGYLPGYPASHGCVRMPEQNAIAFFNAVDVGTPVHVFGRTARSRDYFRFGPQPGRFARDPRYRNQPIEDENQVYEARPVDPRMDPGYDPRLVDPWWR